jgi:hypothetical protein
MFSFINVFPYDCIRFYKINLYGKLLIAQPPLKKKKKILLIHINRWYAVFNISSILRIRKEIKQLNQVKMLCYQDFKNNGQFRQ